jgi:PKD repeat protein
MVGDTLSIYVDTGDGWSVIGTASDSTYASAGYIGLNCYAHQGANTWAVDDFGGGTVSAGLAAGFSAAPLTGTISLTVTFTNLSTPTQAITSALWAYGDGSTSLTTGGVISNTLALTHTHTYTRAGVYTVTLSVSDGVMTATRTYTNYITVSAGIGYTTITRVITYTYDKLYRLTGADYSTGARLSSMPTMPSAIPSPLRFAGRTAAWR